MNKSLTWESEREKKKCFPFENSCVLFVHSLVSIVQRYESQRTGSGWSFCARTDSNKLRVTDSVSQTAQKHSSLWGGWNLTFSCWLRLSWQKCRQYEILSRQLGTSSRSSICFFLCVVEELSEQMPKWISTHWLWIWNRGIAPWGTAGFPGPWSRVSELLPLSWCPGPSGHQPADPPLRSDHTLNYTFPCYLCPQHKSGGDALRVVASRYKVSAIVPSGIKSMRDTVIKTHAGPFLFALWQPEGDNCGFWGEQDTI